MKSEVERDEFKDVIVSGLKSAYQVLSGKNLEDVYLDVSVNSIRKKYEDSEGADAKKKADFLDIMADVIDEKKTVALGRLGLWKGWRYSSNLEDQDKLEKELAKV